MTFTPGKDMAGEGAKTLLTRRSSSCRCSWATASSFHDHFASIANACEQRSAMNRSDSPATAQRGKPLQHVRQSHGVSHTQLVIHTMPIFARTNVSGLHEED